MNSERIWLRDIVQQSKGGFQVGYKTLKNIKISKWVLFRLACEQTSIKSQVEFAKKLGVTTALITNTLRGYYQSRRVKKIIDDFIEEKLGIPGNSSRIVIAINQSHQFAESVQNENSKMAV